MSKDDGLPRYKREGYLNNTTAPVELLGLTPLLNPFAANLSSQRGMMFSSHAPQAQVIHGCEQPRIFTGFESLVGEYEYNTTERDQDMQILEIIPKFVVNSGVYPIKENPFYTIVYRGVEDNKVGYFQLEKFTVRSDGFGYENKWLNTQELNKGNFIPKEVKLCTSPAHDGNKYMLGTNLNVAYMSIPQVTEDAFVISESAYRKFISDHYGRIAFKILPNQIPRNLYGDDSEYKFMPDIGDFVNDEGILTALCTPTADSIITDMSKHALTKVQPLHDVCIYSPLNSKVVDIDIYINRKCKIKTPMEIFAQLQKYKDPINAYYMRIVETYQEVTKQGLQITPAFNTLVTRAISNLVADGVRIPGFTRKADVTLVKKKEAIEFVYVILTYKTVNAPPAGRKVSGRVGN